MLEVINLTSARGERTLFRNVSFKLDASGLLHVAGTNGSGKTSLLRILCGLGAADAGEVRWRVNRYTACARRTGARGCIWGTPMR